MEEEEEKQPVSNVAKAESETTPADLQQNELPKKESIPEENMPVVGGQDLPVDSIPEENMPTDSPARKPANDTIPEENMPAADYSPSADEANREAAQAAPAEQ